MTDGDPAIRNRDDLGTTPARNLALDCVEAGIAAANPRRVVREAVSLDGSILRVAEASYDLADYDEVVVLGGGKAAGGVAVALEGVLGERIDRGVVVTDSAATSPSDSSADSSQSCERIEVHEGDHPVPSERGVTGARKVLNIADEASERTLVLAPITGGASALLPAPADGISLADLRTVTTQLLESGATIAEMNAVRKHCSALKGGRLAERTAPATVVGLVLSDVVGNDLSVIASGPVSPDESTYGDAIQVLARYDIDAPDSVRDRLERGANGAISETPTEDDAAFDRVSVHVLADGLTALEAAAGRASERGYDPLILSARVRGEAREAAKTHAAIAEESRASGNPIEPPAVVLSGGETTVTVRGAGEGGPNLEFALSAALELDAGEGDAVSVALASADTDGRDGGTDVAGAIVDADTVGGQIREDTAREALAENDSLRALADADCVIRTGATGTNVNDLRVVVIEDGGQIGR